MNVLISFLILLQIIKNNGRYFIKPWRFVCYKESNSFTNMFLKKSQGGRWEIRLMSRCEPTHFILLLLHALNPSTGISTVFFEEQHIMLLPLARFSKIIRHSCGAHPNHQNWLKCTLFLIRSIMFCSSKIVDIAVERLRVCKRSKIKWVGSQLDEIKIPDYLWEEYFRHAVE